MARPPSSCRPRRVPHLDQQKFVMRAGRRQRRSGPGENTPDFLESQQVTRERHGSLQIFHVEDEVAEIVGFHFDTLVKRKP
jgi:hypothetical protein